MLRTTEQLACFEVRPLGPFGSEESDEDLHGGTINSIQDFAIFFFTTPNSTKKGHTGVNSIQDILLIEFTIIQPHSAFTAAKKQRFPPEKTHTHLRGSRFEMRRDFNRQ